MYADHMTRRASTPDTGYVISVFKGMILKTSNEGGIIVFVNGFNMSADHMTRRASTPDTGYIISVFKVFEGDDNENFERRWLAWSGMHFRSY